MFNLYNTFFMIIANKYKIIEKLNNGEFGTIFKGENIRTKESKNKKKKTRRMINQLQKKQSS